MASLLAFNSMAASSLRIADSSYVCGDGIVRASFSERFGLVINISNGNTLRFKGMDKVKGAALAKDIAIGKSAQIIDLTVSAS